MKTKNLFSKLIVAIIMILPVFSLAQNFVWAKAMGGTNVDGGHSIALDASGNVITTGDFYATVDFDPGAGVFNLTPAGSGDFFVSKLDAAGNFIWAKAMGGTGYDDSFSITTDALGNVYTTGLFSGTADFDPGTGVFNLTSAGIRDIFVSKLDAAGNFVWAKAMGGIDTDYGRSIAVDALGNVYTTGDFNDIADFDPGTGTFTLTPAGNNDIFVSKLDAAGNFIWAKAFGANATTFDYSRAIALDASGNVYTTGFFEATGDFDPSASVFNLTSAGSSDIFISKLDAAGNFVWAKAMGGTNGDLGYSITADASGNVYSTGSFQSPADFDPGPGVFNLTSPSVNADIFVSKLDASGNFVWAKAMGAVGSGPDYGNSIALDGSGNIYTTGSFNGTADFDPGSGVFNLTSVGTSDIFVSKLDASGNFVWAFAMGGAGADAGNSTVIDASGNIYTTGYFASTADFHPGVGVFNLTSVGSGDIFVHKMNLSGVGIKENAYAINNIAVYPNPSAGIFNLTFPNEAKQSQIEIYNTLGEKVAVTASGNNTNFKVDISNQPNGIYFIHISDEFIRTTHKLIINK